MPRLLGVSEGVGVDTHAPVVNEFVYVLNRLRCVLSSSDTIIVLNKSCRSRTNGLPRRLVFITWLDWLIFLLSNLTRGGSASSGSMAWVFLCARCFCDFRRCASGEKLKLEVNATSSE